MRLSVTAASIAMILVAGCTSFRTTALYRFDNDSVTRECTNKKLKGLPVKLKVPSHIAVTIYEQQVLLAKAGKEATDPVVAYRLVSFDPPQLMVESDMVYTDKVFLVDFRRPAAGILNLSEATMDDDQYFAKIQADVTERTINDVNASLQKLQPVLSKPATPKAAAVVANAAEQASDNISFQKSVIAYQRFDISEPDWECRLQDFVNFQLNRCGTSCPPVTTPAPKPAASLPGSAPAALPPAPATSEAALAPPALRQIFEFE